MYIVEYVKHNSSVVIKATLKPVDRLLAEACVFVLSKDPEVTTIIVSGPETVF